MKDMKAALGRAAGRLGSVRQRSTKDSAPVSGDDVVLSTVPSSIQTYQIVGATDLGGAASPELRAATFGATDRGVCRHGRVAKVFEPKHFRILVESDPQRNTVEFRKSMQS